MTVISTTTVEKTPDEDVVYGIDWTNLLVAGETISTATVVEVSTTDLSIGSTSTSGAVVSVRISGGTAGSTYCLKCTVTTSDSNTKQGFVYLTVANCSQF